MINILPINGLVIIDVQLHSVLRIIGVYIVFNGPGIVTQHAFFTSQLNLIKLATQQKGNKNVVIRFNKVSNIVI